MFWDEGIGGISYLSINTMRFPFARVNHSKNFRLPLQPTVTIKTAEILRFGCQIFRRRSYISVKGEYDDKHET